MGGAYPASLARGRDRFSLFPFTDLDHPDGRIWTKGLTNAAPDTGADIDKGDNRLNRDMTLCQGNARFAGRSRSLSY
jgi:hypothetical protein